MVWAGSLNAQTFLYSYIDPCTHEINYIAYDMSSPIVVSYYGQTNSFNSTQVQDGTLEAWLNSVYSQYQANPCDEVLVSATNVSNTNLTTSVIQTVMNLTMLSSLSSLSVDIGGNVNEGSSGMDEENKEDNDEEENDNISNPANNTSISNGNTETGESGVSTGTSSQSGNPTSGSSNGGTNNQGGTSNTNGTGSGSSPGGSANSQGGSSSSGSGSNGSNNGNNGSSNTGGNTDSGSGNGSNSDGGGNSGGSSSGGTNSSSEESGTGDRSNGAGVREGNTQEGGTPSEEEILESKEDQNKLSSQQVSKSTSKAKAKVQKPAILVTGDIVGLQMTEDKSQDARGTLSFTRVKGDGTASLGFSADYMINAKISNATLMRSWIGVNDKGNKHINLLSTGFSFQPSAWSNTTMAIRVNSLEKLTSIYGAAGSYGSLYGEPITSTLVIAGFMYKGIVVNKVDVTLIAAGVYSPYIKYYTETWWTSRPIVIPFFNLNYRVTKTFGMGLTGGGTYMAGQNVLNYQVLFGAKLIL